MYVNWVTLVGGLLLVSPILLGWIRGLPNELELVKYRMASALHSFLWILSFFIAIWGLHHWVVNNPEPIPQAQWLREQLNSSMVAWMVAVPAGAMILTWCLDFLVQPFISLIGVSLSWLLGFAYHLPSSIGRVLAALLQLPKAVLRVLLLIFGLHIALPFLPFPALSEMVNTSTLYQWVDHRVIAPVITSSWYKQKLPVLGEKAKNWLYSLSEEASDNVPDDAKAILSWQTRFRSNPEIDSKALAITNGAKTDRDKAYRLYTWIGTHVQYDHPKAQNIESGRIASLTFGAIPTYESRKGVCSDYSSLMVVMGKAAGLEVRQEFGEAVLPDGRRGPHAWNTVYLQDEKKWIPIDPTWQPSGNFFDNPDFFATHYPEQRRVLSNMLQ